MEIADLTVVISSYGYGHLIANAIDSVLAQRKKPKEILIVDDGAHDGVSEIAKRYGIKCIERKENLGIIKNYNDILNNHITTSKLMILAADDWLHPDYIKEMDIAADIVSCDIILVGESADKMRGSCKSELLGGYWIWRFNPSKGNIMSKNYIHGSSIYNVALARQYGYRGARKQEGRRLMEDWILFRSMIMGGANHVHIPMPLLYYRKHRFNINGVY
jgi:glycosyltransferase involved in cell wall biosynthesis